MSNDALNAGPVMRGVVTEVTDSGNIGRISCGGGVRYSFDSFNVDAGYTPVLRDIVEFHVVEGKPYGIHLYHREAHISPTSGSVQVNLRIPCPECSKIIIPKARMENGRVTAVVCPECGAVIESNPVAPLSSNKKIFWGALVALILAFAGIFFYLALQK